GDNDDANDGDGDGSATRGPVHMRGVAVGTLSTGGALAFVDVGGGGSGGGANTGSPALPAHGGRIGVGDDDSGLPGGDSMLAVPAVIRDARVLMSHSVLESLCCLGPTLVRLSGCLVVCSEGQRGVLPDAPPLDEADKEDVTSLVDVFGLKAS